MIIDARARGHNMASKIAPMEQLQYARVLFPIENRLANDGVVSFALWEKPVCDRGFSNRRTQLLVRGRWEEQCDIGPNLVSLHTLL